MSCARVLSLQVCLVLVSSHCKCALSDGVCSGVAHPLVPHPLVPRPLIPHATAAHVASDALTSLASLHMVGLAVALHCASFSCACIASVLLRFIPLHSLAHHSPLARHAPFRFPLSQSSHNMYRAQVVASSLVGYMRTRMLRVGILGLRCLLHAIRPQHTLRLQEDGMSKRHLSLQHTTRQA
jgi:hypothetical protein